MTGTIANRETALRLAAAGHHVFPCHPGGEKAKQPMPFIKWKDASTTDPAKIGQWWAKWPDAAVGLDLAKSGLIVIDADRHDPEKDGVEAFGAMMSENGFDPDSAPLVATPSSGNHHFFRQPPGKQYGNSDGGKYRCVSLRDMGINVRGHGGYVIAPGTVMSDGSTYEQFGELENAPILPDWLVKVIDPDRQERPERIDLQTTYTDDRSMDEVRDLLFSINPDCDYQTWVECLMAVHAETAGSGAGMSLVDAWSSNGSKYKGTREIAAKWRSFKRTGITGGTLAEIARNHGADLSAIALKYRGNVNAYDVVEAAEAARRLIQNHDGSFADAETGEVVDTSAIREDDETYGGAPDYQDMPEAHLSPGGLVGEITDWICGSTSEPIRVHAIGAALVTVGTLLSRKVYSLSRPTGTHLYVGMIAPSGWGKDHPQSCAKMLLDEVTGTGISLHSGWASSAPKLGVQLSETANMLMIADEFAEKLAATRGRNASTSMAALNEALKEIWGRSQSSYSVPTALTRSDTVIHRPGMSFLGAATIRDFKESLVSKDVTSGLYNRFLFLPRYGDVDGGPEMDGIIKVPERIASQCKWLYDCLGPLQSAASVRGDMFPASPILVPFSERAQAMNEENRLIQRDMQRRSDMDGSLSLYGRYAEQVKRIAMIVACGRSPHDLKAAVIEGQDMVFAARLVRWSIEQTVLMVRRDMVENWIEANRNKVLGFIRDRKMVRREQLFRGVRSIKGKDMDEIISYLAQSECIEEYRGEPKGAAGRRAIIYKYTQG